MMRKLLAVLILATSACGPVVEDAPPAVGDTGADRLLVVASTSIWADVVAGVGGEAVRVETLIPVGVDAHDFQPSPQHGRLLREADLVVVNGLGLEEGLLDLVETAEEEGTAVLEMAPLLDPLPFREDPRSEDDHPDEDEAHEDEDDHGHAEGDLDPHVWFDPVRMARAAEILAERLAELDPRRAGLWRAGGEGYRDRILEAHAEVEEILAAVPPERRRLVTNHEALGYFADRYGFEVVGTVIPAGTTLAEPSARELAALVEVIRREDVPAIFAETTNPSALADAVAREVGRPVRVVLIYTESLGEPGSGAETYPGMLLTDARRIAEALR